MIKYLLFILFLFMSTVCYAEPTYQEYHTALTLMYLDETEQELHFTNTSNYESTQPQLVSGLIHYATAYSTFNGKGYILSVIKVENGKVWRIQRHYGPENLSIDDYWICVNCNGESYNFPTINEHGLCETLGE